MPHLKQVLGVRGADASWQEADNSARERERTSGLHLGGLGAEHAGATEGEVWGGRSLVADTTVRRGPPQGSSANILTLPAPS